MKTIVKPYLSAASIDSWSRTDPPGWMMALIPASDAFFPFADNVEEIAKAGIKAIIQPGGSVRDQESIEAADKYGLTMVFTGVRHFRH